jgi:hypothetical protein
MDTAGSYSFAFYRGTTAGFAIPIGTVKSIGTAIKEAKKSSSTAHGRPTHFVLTGTSAPIGR